MFNKFLWLIEELPESIGKIVNAHLYDAKYATAEIVDRLGDTYHITFTKKTEEENHD